MGPIVAALVIGAAGWFVYKAVTGGLSDSRFSIVVRASGVRLKGRVPGKSDSDIIEFVTGLQLPTGAKIWGVPNGDRLMLRFSGGVPDNLQQRVRNYVMN